MSEEFAERIAAPTPTPGGGAVAARVGLYAVSLLRMVVGITLKKQREAPPGGAPAGAALDPAGAEALDRLEAEGKRLARDFEDLEQEDMAAFQSYLDALRLPRATPAEKEARRQARSRAALRATQAPLATMRAVRRLLEMAVAMHDLARTTPLRAESDLAAGIELGHACSRVAELNIQANLGDLIEADRAASLKEWRELQQKVTQLYSQLRSGSEQPAT